MPKHTPGPLKDQIQAVLDFAAAGRDETQYQMFEDPHNHVCYNDEDRENFKQNQADYFAGIAVVDTLPDLLGACRTAYDNLKPLYSQEHLVIKKLAEAIAKAKGGI